jgi:LysM repeat protein
VPARVSAVFAAVVVGLTVVACSDDSTESAGAGGTSVAVDDSRTAGPGDTYTVDAGDTLSGIAASYGLTFEELIAANGWSDGAEHAIFPGDVVELPAGVVAVSTTRSASANGSAPTSTQPTGRSAAGGYRDTGLPYAGPDRGTTDPIADPLPDGVYWATAPAVDGGGESIVFTLQQRFTGDDCLEQYTTAPLNCIGDGFAGGDTTTASMLVSNSTATVIAVDEGISAAYDISTEELLRLIRGEAPAADAPEGYSYVPYPFIVTVRNGEIVAADQQFQS